MTKIFTVQYEITERYDGKNPFTQIETKNVVGKDGMDAISKAKVKAEKSSSYISEETGKRVKETRNNFKLVSLNLLAETD